MSLIEIHNEESHYEKAFEKFVIEQLYELRMLVHEILKSVNHPYSEVTGGSFHQTGDTMLPISPGNSPQFAITPTFTGDPVLTLRASATILSSDPVNFPIAFEDSDTTGLNLIAVIPTTAVIPGGSEAITVTWTYTNTSGSVVTVVGNVTETGIVPVSEVNGGSFAQTI